MAKTLKQLCRYMVAALAAGIAVPPNAAAADSVVVVIPVREEITQNTLFLFRRAMREARARRATAIVLDMDTPGGVVSVTKKIVTMLLKSEFKTYTFVNNAALSGGSYVAAATQHIYMAQAATIGASTPVAFVPFAGPLEMPPDMRRKQIDAMKALMRAAAEQNGHRPEVFEAMVDPDLELVLDDKKICEKGKLLVLTSSEAEQKYGNPPKPLLSEGTVKDLPELLERAGLASAEVVRIHLTGFEHVGRFLSFISPLLILLGMLGIYIEMNTPGFGIPGISAIVCFALVFLGSYVSGLAGWEHFLLLLLGIGLLAVEIFLIPGFGVTGIAGIICICAALLLMMTERFHGGSWLPTWEELQIPLLKLSLSVIGAVVAGYFISKFIPKTSLWQRMELSAAAVTAPADVSVRLVEVGEIGVAETPLRPAGKARFGERLVDVVTQGDLIEKRQRVKVVEVQGARVVVVKAKEQAQGA